MIKWGRHPVLTIADFGFDRIQALFLSIDWDLGIERQRSGLADWGGLG